MSAAPVRNWAGNHGYRFGAFAEPTSLAELQDVVSQAERVRVLGTGHSFNALPDTTGTLVSLRRMPDGVRVDPQRAVAAVGGGVPYARVVTELHRRGWALPTTGSLPHISVAGAVATGTHGSGVGHQVLAGPVSAITTVLGDGSLHTARRGEPGFEGHVVALGATGVVVDLELDLVPTYDVVQQLHPGLAWRDLLADPAAVLALGSSVSVFTLWSGADDEPVGEVLVKQRTDAEPATTPGRERLLARLGDPRPPGAPSSVLGDGDNLTPRGGAGPWHTRMPHFRHDREPSWGDEQQSEWFVPLERAAEAVDAVRSVADVLAPALIAGELRSIGADDIWLSMVHGRDSLALHFTWRNDDALVGEAVRTVEAALAAYDARPHWGKVAGPVDVDRLYPRAADFRALRRTLDPAGVFVNDHLERLGLV